MRVRKTSRGFKIIKFTDLYGEKCSLQESSLATARAIWFGCDENGKPHHVTGQTLSPRMHLSQKQVRELLPVLQWFAETGELPPSMSAAKRGDA